MLDLELFGPGTCVGYCTNIHAGASLPQVRENLVRYASQIRERLCPGSLLGIGLWLAAASARQLVLDDELPRFVDQVRSEGLKVFTFNGFPYGDFHSEEVKLGVYEPDWSTRERVLYTLDLITVLAAMLEPGETGSLSTVPVTWGKVPGRIDLDSRTVENFDTVLERLRALEGETGILIHLDVEPEPGCLLDCATDVVEFFEDYRSKSRHDATTVHRHLRVCHDICHSAVMFEPQEAVLDRYRRAGVKIGKVQISSAIVASFEASDARLRKATMEALEAFRDRRYLHQTCVLGDSGRRFFDDLPEALAAARRGEVEAGEWRVHFHVPIDVASLGPLGTTRGQIDELLSAIREDDEIDHFEVETYAWEVIPASYRSTDLTTSVVRELSWLQTRFEPRGAVNVMA